METEVRDSRYARLCHMTGKGVAWLATLLLSLLSVYIILGWITIEDLRKYCVTNGLNLESTLSALVPTETIGEFKGDKKGYSFKDYHSGSNSPVYRYLLPFNMIHMEKDSLHTVTGAVFEPFLALSENSRNAVCCFGIGYLVGILMIGLESLRGRAPSTKRLLLRPTLGGISGVLLFVVILSGGALIWNEVNGIKGLSLGMIAVIGSLLCERFADLVGASA
jgi:hypothetical protein